MDKELGENHTRERFFINGCQPERSLRWGAGGLSPLYCSRLGGSLMESLNYRGISSPKVFQRCIELFLSHTVAIMLSLIFNCMCYILESPIQQRIFPSKISLAVLLRNTEYIKIWLSYLKMSQPNVIMIGERRLSSGLWGKNRSFSLMKAPQEPTPRCVCQKLLLS